MSLSLSLVPHFITNSSHKNNKEAHAHTRKEREREFLFLFESNRITDHTMPSSIGDRLYELMRKPSEERQKYRVLPPNVSLGMKFNEDGFSTRDYRERGSAGGNGRE